MNPIFIFSLLLAISGYSQVSQEKITSSLEVYNLKSRSRKVIYSIDKHFEAPNWSRDGKMIVFNSNGLIYTIPAKGGKPELLNTSFADKCNNDHGISPDGKSFVISHHEKETGNSKIYILPMSGGTPKLITPLAPSYWHGWSPDGTTIAYCAERNSQYDIYTINTAGGEEKQLTTSEGLDDGPDYSPDGKYIYFNSVRTGKMKIWRMKIDGSEQTQLTFDDYNDWFAHPSPDGKWLVFVSYEPDVKGHPANKNVKIRIMPVGGGKIESLINLFGGQGTINVPSWSPDSKQFSFVSYRLGNN